MNRTKLYAHYCWCLFKYMCALIIAFFIKLNKPSRNIWLIGERGTDARDNGFALYKYIRENYPEINIFYVIEKKSSDFEKVSRIGKTVDKGSFKHYILFALSKIKVSSHIMGYSPNISLFTSLERYGPIVMGKKVFLQHGIIKDDIYTLHSDQVRLDLFVCGAKPEFDFVLKNYGFNKNVVKYLGLARFDSLQKNISLNEQVLLMPTWRWMHNGIKDAGDFIRTDYYKEYQKVINSKEIDNLLARANKKMIFYPHYEVQKYIDCFTTQSKNIIIAKFEEHDVQKLLKESKVLITDYSSVYFDFAYMRKPIIYYHFDYNEYRKTQYQEGYFDYSRDGFGPITNDLHSLFTALEKVLCNNETVSQFKERVNGFFPLYDQENCKRNYSAIIDLVTEKGRSIN
jgi:CDP-glycerol glycerophosphotransferase